MKKYSLLIALVVSAAGLNAQLNIQSGATFFIQSGATVTVQGDVTSNADIQGPGVLLLKGSALQTVNMNGFSVQNVQVDNTNNVSLGGAATLGTNLTFTTGKVLLNGFDLNLASAATLTGFDNAKYFVTNGAGRLVKNSLSTAFTYPVGFDASSYNPLSITQGGTVDNIGVRCLQNVLQNGTSGAPFVKEVVDASWAVTEAVAGGSSLSMTSTWTGTDELPGFNRAKTGISYYDGVGWDMLNTQTLAAAGAGPYTITRSSVSNLANGGIFAVGTRPVLTQLLVSPKTFLQGPYAGANLMNDNLRASSLIPLNEPYTGMTNFSHITTGSGGGESISSAILAGTGTGNDIVDWMFAELRDAGTGAVVNSRAVLIERDGDLVDVDGTGTRVNFINFAGAPAGSYHVSLRHRNHLGIRTASPFALSRTSTSIVDFTSGAAQALSGVQVNLFGSGVFGMYAGNVNGNGNVRYTLTGNDQNELLNVILGGVKSTVLSNVYHRGDLNLNGVVRYTLTGNDENVLLNIVLGGNKALVLTQPF